MTEYTSYIQLLSWPGSHAFNRREFETALSGISIGMKAVENKVIQGWYATIYAVEFKEADGGALGTGIATLDRYGRSLRPEHCFTVTNVTRSYGASKDIVHVTGKTTSKDDVKVGENTPPKDSATKRTVDPTFKSVKSGGLKDQAVKRLILKRRSALTSLAS